MGKKSMQQSIENHLRVLALLRDEGPKSAVEINNTLGKTYRIPRQTLYDILDRIVQTKWAIIVTDGKHEGEYAYYWYKDLEWEIENYLRKEGFVGPRGFFPWDSGNVFHIAMKLGTTNNEDFKAVLRKVVDRLGLSILTHPNRP